MVFGDKFFLESALPLTPLNQQHACLYGTFVAFEDNFKLERESSEFEVYTTYMFGALFN